MNPNEQRTNINSKKEKSYSTYKVWFRFMLSHEYYAKTSCPVLLAPSEETKLLFKKSNLIFRQINNGEYWVLKEEKFQEHDLLDEQPRLSFDLYPLNHTFYYVSDKIEKQELFFSVNDEKKPRVWKPIELNIPYLINRKPEEISVNITTVLKYYEYIFIPKYSKTATKIKLTEERNRITFKEAEQISLPDIPIAFRFLADKKIKLTQENNLKMQLWELKEHGDRLLSDQIPNPQPGECSLVDPKNVLTTYFYY